MCMGILMIEHYTVYMLYTVSISLEHLQELQQPINILNFHVYEWTLTVLYIHYKGCIIPWELQIVIHQCLPHIWPMPDSNTPLQLCTHTHTESSKYSLNIHVVIHSTLGWLLYGSFKRLNTVMDDIILYTLVFQHVNMLQQSQWKL